MTDIRPGTDDKPERQELANGSMLVVQRQARGGHAQSHWYLGALRVEPRLATRAPHWPQVHRYNVQVVGGILLDCF